MKYGLPIPTKREDIESCIVKYNKIIELIPESNDKKYGLIRGNLEPIYFRRIYFVDNNKNEYGCSIPNHYDNIYVDLINAVSIMEKLIEKDIDYIISDKIEDFNTLTKKNN